MSDSIRIFQLAKELNISHTDILDFLKSKDISVSSHMSPIDGKTQQLVYTEFAKDRQSAERDRKEQVRKEIHDSKVVMKTSSTLAFWPANKYDNVFSLDSALYMQQHGLVSVDVSIQDQGVCISSFEFCIELSLLD